MGPTRHSRTGRRFGRVIRTYFTLDGNFAGFWPYNGCRERRNMKLTWYSKILCGTALLVAIACGGSSSGGGTGGTSVALHEKFVNNSGATASFTPSGGTAQSVAPGQSKTISGNIVVPNGQSATTFTVNVVGGGGEHASGNIVVGPGDNGKTVTATWDDVSVIMSKG
jgi:hypothetical protein